MVEGATLKDHIGRVEKSIKTIFSRMIHHTIKVLAIFYFKHYCMCKTTFGSGHGRVPKHAELLVLKNGCTDLIDRSAISSTQQEVPGL